MVGGGGCQMNPRQRQIAALVALAPALVLDITHACGAGIGGEACTGKGNEARAERKEEKSRWLILLFGGLPTMLTDRDTRYPRNSAC